MSAGKRHCVYGCCAGRMEPTAQGPRCDLCGFTLLKLDDPRDATIADLRAQVALQAAAHGRALASVQAEVRRLGDALADEGNARLTAEAEVARLREERDDALQMAKIHRHKADEWIAEGKRLFDQRDDARATLALALTEGLRCADGLREELSSMRFHASLMEDEFNDEAGRLHEERDDG